jgi:hypothetical protein
MSMSYHAEAYEDYDRPRFQKKSLWIIAAGILCVLAAGVGILAYAGTRRIPEIGGGLTIEADPDTKIYLGDKQVGTSQVSYTWEELFGDEEHESIATELPSPASSVTAEMVSGPGATILNSEGRGGGGSGPSGINVNTSGFWYLIRRADGQLDQVVPIIIDWTPANEPPRRYLLPIRFRKGFGASTVFFNLSFSGTSSSGGPGFIKAFGRSPSEIKKTWRFSVATPPDKFAEEIKSKGLWEPGREK